MKKYRGLAILVVAISFIALFLSSCCCWYDLYDEPVPPPHRYYYRYHRPYYGW